MTAQTPVACSGWSERKKDWLCVALLVALIVPFRVWLVYNTEVPARDSVGFVRYALHFEEFSWGDVLRRHHQHPGYPLAIWLVSLPVRAVAGTTPESMQLSAQLASSLAAVLLLVPMFLIGKRLFDRRVGFWSALWFQTLPVCAHHFSDGISESWFLLLIAWSLYLSLKAFDTFSPRLFALAGMFGGLAYLTRPEGALVVVAMLMVLGGMQLLRRRQTWSGWLHSSAALTTTALLVGSLYFGFTGKFSNKPATNIIPGNADPNPVNVPMNAHVGASGFLQANLFAAFIQPSGSLGTRFVRGVSALVTELTHVFHYVGGLAAFAGLWWFGPTLRRIPGSWVILTYGLLQTFILVALSMTAFYVSDRHVMILAFCVIAPATAGLIEAPRRFLAWRQTRRAQASSSSPRGWGGSVPAWTLAVLLLTMAFCLPKSLQRIHGNRAGNHAAGRWLAQNITRGDLIVDDHAWSHYYAGQLFIEGKEPVLLPGYQPTCYVVITRSADVQIGQKRAGEERELRKAGPVVYHWPENRPEDQARIVVYAQPRDYAKYPWYVASAP